jgi:hypothetical protein
VFVSRVPPVNRVVGIWRRMFAEGGNWEKAIEALAAKYGPPVGGPASAAFWGDRSMLAGRERSQCNGDSVGQLPWEDWTEDGRPVRLLASRQAEALGAPLPPLLRDADVPGRGAGAAKLAECFPVLYVRSTGDNPATVEARLFDMRVLAWLRSQAGSSPPRAVVTATRTADARPSAANAGPDPKLAGGPTDRICSVFASA